MTLEKGTALLETTTAAPSEAQGDAIATAVASASVRKAETADDEFARLAELEQIAPGTAKAWLESELARDKGRRFYRFLNLCATLVLCVCAIGFGQWALVNGATSEALFLSGTSLVGLVGALLQKR